MEIREVDLFDSEKGVEELLGSEAIADRRGQSAVDARTVVMHTEAWEDSYGSNIGAVE